MNAPIFLLITLALTISAAVVLRLWLRSLPNSQPARRWIVNVIMWLGCLICVAALVISLISKNSQSIWLLTSTGLLIVVSMLLARRGTQPK